MPVLGYFNRGCDRGYITSSLWASVCSSVKGAGQAGLFVRFLPAETLHGAKFDIRKQLPGRKEGNEHLALSGFTPGWATPPPPRTVLYACTP